MSVTGTDVIAETFVVCGADIANGMIGQPILGLGGAHRRRGATGEPSDVGIRHGAPSTAREPDSRFGVTARLLVRPCTLAEMGEDTNGTD